MCGPENIHSLGIINYFFAVFFLDFFDKLYNTALSFMSFKKNQIF